ncbi:MAG: hypothetical protein V3W41_13205 [Planctomycetota bacterium]
MVTLTACQTSGENYASSADFQATRESVAKRYQLGVSPQERSEAMMKSEPQLAQRQPMARVQRVENVRTMRTKALPTRPELRHEGHSAPSDSERIDHSGIRIRILTPPDIRPAMVEDDGGFLKVSVYPDGGGTPINEWDTCVPFGRGDPGLLSFVAVDFKKDYEHELADKNQCALLNQGHSACFRIYMPSVNIGDVVEVITHVWQRTGPASYRVEDVVAEVKVQAKSSTVCPTANSRRPRGTRSPPDINPTMVEDGEGFLRVTIRPDGKGINPNQWDSCVPKVTGKGDPFSYVVLSVPGFADEVVRVKGSHCKRLNADRPVTLRFDGAGAASANTETTVSIWTHVWQHKKGTANPKKYIVVPKSADFFLY